MATLTRKKNIQTQSVIYILSGMVAILLIVLGFLAYRIKVTGEEASRLGLVLGEHTLEEREFLGLREVLQRTEENRTKLEHYFITSEEIVDFIEQIESLAEHTGTTLTFDVVSVKENDSRETLDLSFTVEGAFADTFYFLRLIEELPFQILFKDAEFDARGGGGDFSGRWRARFSLSLLSFSKN